MAPVASVVGTVAEAFSRSGIDLAALGLAWARAMPAVTLVPAFGLRALPAPGRGVMALAFAAVIFPALAPVAHDASQPWLWLVLVEVARGLPVALAAAVPLWAATMAGGVADALRGSQETPAVPTVEGRATPLGVPLSLLAMFGVGFGVISMSATANTLIQLNVPDHLRGRVMSVYTTVFAGSTPVGALGTGAVASALGAAVAVGIAGLLSALVALAGAVYVFRTGLADHSGETEFGSGGVGVHGGVLAEIANAGTPGPAAAMAVALTADSIDRLAPAAVGAGTRTRP